MALRSHRGLIVVAVADAMPTLAVTATDRLADTSVRDHAVHLTVNDEEQASVSPPIRGGSRAGTTGAIPPGCGRSQHDSD